MIIPNLYLPTKARAHLPVALAILSMALSSMTLAEGNDVVTIVNPAAPMPSRDLISEVYLGHSTAFVPFDLPSATPLHDKFYLSVIGRQPAQVREFWARLVFTGRGLPPKVLADASAMKRAVANNPKAIGYIDKLELDASVKSVATEN